MLISALVHHQDGGPGHGFYDLAERKGLIPRGMAPNGAVGKVDRPRCCSPSRLQPRAGLTGVISRLHLLLCQRPEIALP